MRHAKGREVFNKVLKTNTERRYEYVCIKLYRKKSHIIWNEENKINKVTGVSCKIEMQSKIGFVECCVSFLSLI